MSIGVQLRSYQVRKFKRRGFSTCQMFVQP